MSLITLREAAEAGIFPTLDAARKAAQRAQLAPAGRRGEANLYWAEDLAACQPGKPVEAAEVAGETWKPIPGYPAYEASDLGRVRSIDRVQYGRTYRSTVLATRVSNRNYDLLNIRDEHANTQTRTVHTLVLLAFVGPCPPGHETRHLNDNPHDNRLVNLAYGTKDENIEDQFRNGRPRAAPKPPKMCPRCSAEHHDPGRRCHACVVEIGEEIAKLLVAGVPLDQAAEKLDYPSHAGALTLACKYGGLRLTLAAPSQAVTAAPLPRPGRWLRWVTGSARTAGDRDDAP